MKHENCTKRKKNDFAMSFEFVVLDALGKLCGATSGQIVRHRRNFPMKYMSVVVVD